MSERAVWKYELELIDEPQHKMMPEGARIVHVGSRWETVCMWAEAYMPTTPLVRRWFSVEGTGHPVNDHAEYVGTALTHNEALVWHVYEEHAFGPTTSTEETT